MFAKGTKIMYGNTGVCEVMDYATPDLPGMPRGIGVRVAHEAMSNPGIKKNMKSAHSLS